MKTPLYRIPGPWRGTLAIIPRPRGGEWLEAEVQSWKVVGIDAVVSLLTNLEAWELGVAQEKELSEGGGIRFFPFAIPDRQTPRSVADFHRLTRQIASLLEDGQTVAIHCRQSVGRSALLAATLLVEAGVNPDEAFDRIQRARGCPVPDTPEQRAWVEKLASAMKKSPAFL